MKPIQGMFILFTQTFFPRKLTQAKHFKVRVKRIAFLALPKFKFFTF